VAFLPDFATVTFLATLAPYFQLQEEIPGQAGDDKRVRVDMQETSVFLHENALRLQGV